MKNGESWMCGLTVAVILLCGCAKAPKNRSPIPEESRRGYFSDSGRPGSEGRNLRELLHPEVGARERTGVSFAEAMTDELWVISRAGGDSGARDDQYPGTGAMMTKVQNREVPLPLAHTQVKANVSGYLASVDVTQQFENPFAEKIEAVYVFPLPENGAVNEFVMQVGARRIRGIVRERREAERIYTDAKRQGYTAALLTQERPNIFIQSVANIEPGKRIDISIRYYHTLAYADGWYEFVFPMVVGPRFNPPGFHGGIGAVPASGLARSGQPMDAHYLAPETRSGHDIGLELEVNAGVRIEDYECKTHAVTVRPKGAEASVEHLEVSLNPGDSIPNKDFVFRYRVAGGTIKTGLITHQDHRGGFFTLMMYPPAALETLERRPMELVFVLDCSGSMAGRPLAQAKAAVRWALRHMDARDTFQLINFSADARQFGSRPVAVTAENIRRALRHLESLQSEGGTMMIEGVKAALDFPHDPARLRFICFLTDGFIGNETEILREIHGRLGDSRIFSFGVGSSVNRFLLEGMAKVGRGAVAYLGLNDNGGQIMGDFFERVSHPALTEVEIHWGGFKASDVFPKRLPDLFVGRPVILTGRFEPGSGGKTPVIELSGRAGGSRVRIPVSVRESGAEESSPALPSLWARSKVAELLEKSPYDPSRRTMAQARQTALDYQILSPDTAFLALDASRRTVGESGVTVPIALPVPEGVRYDTTVSE
ncbi:MAG: VWA domain-containing protein [Gammaproteobacteria bacterium]|nr:VWA domain-containing protein [Gammaproteobacteria bacterium]